MGSSIGYNGWSFGHLNFRFSQFRNHTRPTVELENLAAHTAERLSERALEKPAPGEIRQLDNIISDSELVAK